MLAVEIKSRCVVLRRQRPSHGRPPRVVQFQRPGGQMISQISCVRLACLLHEINSEGGQGCLVCGSSTGSSCANGSPLRCLVCALLPCALQEVHIYHQHKSSDTFVDTSSNDQQHLVALSCADCVQGEHPRKCTWYLTICMPCV